MVQAESDLSFNNKANDNEQSTPWSGVELLESNLPSASNPLFAKPEAGGKTQLSSPAQETPAKPGEKPETIGRPPTEKDNILGGFSLDTKAKAAAKSCDGPDCKDGKDGGMRSLGDKVSEIIGKIGQFLQSVLPPEYAQYVQQYLPMAEQFVSGLFNDVRVGEGQNGAKRLELDLKQSRSLKDVIPGTNVELGPKLALEAKWNGSGADITNISGVKVEGADLKGARLDINGGNPSLNLTVQDKNGQTKEIPVPLPNIQDLISNLQAKRKAAAAQRRR